MREQLKPSSGFTLTEITSVVIIVGILAAVALPKYHLYLIRVQYGEAIPILKALRDAQVNYSYEHGQMSAGAVDSLDVTIPTMKYFGIPAVSSVSVSTTTNVLASVTDSTGKYVLSIRVDGKIYCADIGADTVCAQIRCIGTGGACN